MLKYLLCSAMALHYQQKSTSLIHHLPLVWQCSCLKLPPGCLTHLSNGSSWAMRCSFWMISAASLIWRRERERRRLSVCVWERERERERCKVRGKEREHDRTMRGGRPDRKRAGRRRCLHLGDHHLRAALLHLPVLNRELITDRLRSPGHRQQQQQQQSWLSSISNSLLACLFWMGCNPTGV